MTISLNIRRKKIEAYIKERRQYLAEQEEQLAHLQVAIPQIKSAIAMSEAELNSVIHSIESDKSEYDSDLPMHRNPMDMLRSKYKGMKLSDIAAQVLDASGTPMTTTDMARQIYSTDNNDELSRARNSLSTELRSGIKGDKPMWKKIGRNAYASLQYKKQEVA